jgi:hypothetical protein
MGLMAPPALMVQRVRRVLTVLPVRLVLMALRVRLVLMAPLVPRDPRALMAR